MNTSNTHTLLSTCLHPHTKITFTNIGGKDEEI